MKFSSRRFVQLPWLGLAVVVGVLFLVSTGFAATELHLLTIYGGEPKIWWEKLYEEYAKTHPGIKIVGEVITDDVILMETEQTRLGAGVGPDIYFTWGGEIAGMYIDAGFAEPLERYFEKYNWNETFIPWAVETLKRHGKSWGVPLATQGMTFWYRVDLWNKLGLSEPQTYEEVEALCEKAKTAGIYPITIAGKHGWHAMRLTDYLLEAACGSELHDKLNNREVSWNRPEVIAAYRLFKKWVDKGWIIRGFMGINPPDARMPWYQGKALMTFEGSWFGPVIKEDEQDIKNFDFFLHPTDHEPLRISAFCEQYIINSQSKHKDEAAEFLNWLSQREIQQKYYGKAMYSTATVGVAPDKEELPRSYRWRKVLEKMGGTFLPSDQIFDPELIRHYYDVQNGLTTGKLTPEEGAKKMQEGIEMWEARKKK